MVCAIKSTYNIMYSPSCPYIDAVLDFCCMQLSCTHRLMDGCWGSTGYTWGGFSKPISPTSMQRICKGYVPANTRKSTKWALGVFHHWRDAQNNATAEEEKCPADLFADCNVKTLNYWLSWFVVDVRWEDGKPYPASSISNILAGLYRHDKTIVPDFPNLMIRKDASFRELTGAIQVRFRELRQQGVGAMVKHAAIVSESEEDALWMSGVVGTNDPLVLQAVFYYAGKVFCLRGGEEQTDLTQSQFVRSSDPDCYTYVEQGSKTRFGFNQKEANKVVLVYACTDSCPMCLVYLLDLYLSKLPESTKDMDLRPRLRLIHLGMIVHQLERKLWRSIWLPRVQLQALRRTITASEQQVHHVQRRCSRKANLRCHWPHF